MLFSGCLKSKERSASSTKFPTDSPPFSLDHVVLIPSKGSLDFGRSPPIISMYSVLLPKLGALPNPCDL